MIIFDTNSSKSCDNESPEVNGKEEGEGEGEGGTEQGGRRIFRLRERTPDARNVTGEGRRDCAPNLTTLFSCKYSKGRAAKGRLREMGALSLTGRMNRGRGTGRGRREVKRISRLDGNSSLGFRRGRGGRKPDDARGRLLSA